MDKVDQIGITIEENDAIETISGVGEAEFVYQKNVDCIKFGDIEVRDFIIEVGVMDYGFNLNGIIGMDFLKNITPKPEVKK